MGDLIILKSGLGLVVVNLLMNRQIMTYSHVQTFYKKPLQTIAR